MKISLRTMLFWLFTPVLTYWVCLCLYIVCHASSTCNCAEFVVGCDPAHCALPRTPILFEISSTHIYTHSRAHIETDIDREALVRVPKLQCGGKRRGRCRQWCQTMFCVTNRFQFDFDKSFCTYRSITYQVCQHSSICWWHYFVFGVNSTLYSIITKSEARKGINSTFKRNDTIGKQN